MRPLIVCVSDRRHIVNSIVLDVVVVLGRLMHGGLDQLESVERIIVVHVVKFEIVERFLLVAHLRNGFGEYYVALFEFFLHVPLERCEFEFNLKKQPYS